MKPKSSSSLSHPLRGVIPPMITPLREQDTIDTAGLERLIEHILGGGVHGLFILGTTGEAQSLSYRLRRELIDRACAQVARRVPVLVGITDPSPIEAQRLADHAADAGADALVLAAPFYFPIQQSELIAYVEDLAQRLPLPTFLYNMPSHTKIHFTPETVRRMLDIERIAGLKDSSPNAACFREVRDFVLAQRPDFSLLIGSEQLMAECIPQRAHGGVCGGANAFPRLFVDLYDAAVAGDAQRVEALQARVLRLAVTIYAVGNAAYAAIRGIKGALAYLGICNDFVASPLQVLNDHERRAIALHLSDQELLIQDESVRGASMRIAAS